MNGLARFVPRHLLEILLGLAAVGLLWQLGVGAMITDLELFGLDKWSRTQSIVLNAVALLVLVCYRWSPGILESFGGRHSMAERTTQADVADDREP